MTKIIMFISGAVVLLTFISFLYAIPVFFLWNWLMPEIFGITKITFIQAFGITWLSSFLFKTTNTSGSK